MRVKLLIAVFLILGILGLLFFTQQGRSFLKFLNLQPAFSSFLALFNLQQAEGKSFFFSLQINRNYLSGNFEAHNASFITNEGIVILMNKVPLSVPEGSQLRIEDAQGSFEIDSEMKANLNAKKVYLGKILYGPADLKIEFETYVQGATISGVYKDSISFSKISGRLEQLAEDGSVKHSVNLENDELKINNFFGMIKLDDELAYIQGYCTKIQGKIKGLNFEWFG